MISIIVLSKGSLWHVRYNSEYYTVLPEYVSYHDYAWWVDFKYLIKEK